jgi:hypothetical protein
MHNVQQTISSLKLGQPQSTQNLSMVPLLAPSDATPRSTQPARVSGVPSTHPMQWDELRALRQLARKWAAHGAASCSSPSAEAL